MAHAPNAKLAKAGVEVVGEAVQVEPVNEDPALKKLLEDEAFMNEMVEILIHPSSNEEDPDHVVLAVNGTNQPVFRDVPTTIKRKYVEVLARMKETKYSQKRHPIELDRSELVPRTGPIYPFEVLRDDNPKGRAWLRSIISEVE